MEIKRFETQFSVCKVEDYSLTNLNDEFVFIGKTNDELSLVCPTNSVPKNAHERDDGWMAMRIQGILDFSLIGILAPIASILADNKIGIFVISTFNTDYILVKSENYKKAIEVLAKAEYIIVS